MKTNSIYRVRVLYLGGDSISQSFPDFDSAKERFSFLVSCCLLFDDFNSVRCINIFKNNVCLRYYSNQSNHKRITH